MENTNSNPTVMSLEEMRTKYGRLFERGSPLHLEKGRVPKALWLLLPYAQFWELSDDYSRDQLVSAAPPEVQENLAAVVAKFDTDLTDWLAGVESYSTTPSAEYVAFSALRMAADYAQAICTKRKEGRPSA